MKCPYCKREIGEQMQWVKIPELNIEVEREVHNKGETYTECIVKRLSEHRLMYFNEVIWLANSKYAKDLKMDGSSDTDDFFIEQPFNLNKKNNLVARFRAYSDGVVLYCCGDLRDSDSGLGVRWVRDLKKVSKK